MSEREHFLLDCEEPAKRWKWIDQTLSDALEYRHLVRRLLISERISDCCDAFWLHGSRAVGTHQPQSDLDLAFLMKPDRCEGELWPVLQENLECQTLSGNYLSDEDTIVWSCSGREVGLRILTYLDLEHTKSRIFTSIQGLESNQALVQHLFVNSRPIFDSRGEITRMRAAMLAYPDHLGIELSSRYLRRLKNKCEWWRIRSSWKGAFEELSDTCLIVDEIVRCHYALNRMFFMPGMKEYPRDILRMRPDLTLEMDLLIRDESEGGVRGNSKRNLIETIIRKLENEIGH